jgi:hypothetical protein
MRFYDARSGRAAIVTCIEVEEQIDECIRDYPWISTDKIAREMKLCKAGMMSISKHFILMELGNIWIIWNNIHLKAAPLPENIRYIKVIIIIYGLFSKR